MSDSIKIKLLSVQQTQEQKNGRVYNTAKVAYINKTFGDKLEGKTLVDFSNREVFKTICNAKPESLWKVERSKNNNFWNWDKVTEDTEVEEKGEQVTKGYVKPSNTYETAEERKQRQTYIIRQSSLANAIATLKTDKVALDPNVVLVLAQTYEDWIFRDDDHNIMTTIEEDIPQ